MAWTRRKSKSNDGKYLRLTGLWANKKKDNLFTGKMRAEDVEKLAEKASEANESGSDLVFFLWVNEQEKHTDPEFTLQVSVSEGEVGSSRRKSYGRGRDDRDDRSEREEERDSKRSKRDEPEEEPEDEAEEEPEEKPARKGKPAPAKSRGAEKDDW